ncbi:p-loop containing nucleoside triphosphate hydrolase protein [Mycena chlorophos]|uniref:p-loop containing nucleoside triphosphate hydrolase protein n=1 Tax=Mycena chlorophos TaxID=658473 RepID=A0A8H6RY46_MYCCL|nr:p-loop containing nucleoside triphosphate hydrolase protein [Mycena chlorophos]
MPLARRHVPTVIARSLASEPTRLLHVGLGLRYSGAEFLAEAVNSEQIPPLKAEPEAVFLGRANAGKSTLLNLVMGRHNLVITSNKPGATKSLKFFRWQLAAPGHARNVVLVDAPGYGARGRVEWGTLVDAYIENRKQLRRIYVCINAKTLLNRYDFAMLEHLIHLAQDRDGQWAIQPIITKIDTIPLKEVPEHIREIVRGLDGLPKRNPELLRKPFVTGMEKRQGISVERVRLDLAAVAGLVLGSDL